MLLKINTLRQEQLGKSLYNTAVSGTTTELACHIGDLTVNIEKLRGKRVVCLY